MSWSSSNDPLPPDRAVRLVQRLHQVCSHDLPNQAVALESLLHLFTMDEADRLSADGQEYLQRLRSVAHKIAGMVQYLRDLIRLARHDGELSDIVLGRFVVELQGELHRHIPERAFAWSTQFDVPAVVADRRLLLQAMAALVQAAAEACGEAAQLSVALTTQSAGEAVECRIVVAPESMAAAGLSTTTKLDQRLEFLLAREFLALADIGCRTDDTAATPAYVLTITPRSAHG